MSAVACTLPPVRRGDQYVVTLRFYTDASKSARLNLTGDTYTAPYAMSNAGPSLAAFTVDATNAATGDLVLRLDDVTTAALQTTAKLHWRLHLTTADVSWLAGLASVVDAQAVGVPTPGNLIEVAMSPVVEVIGTSAAGPPGPPGSVPAGSLDQSAFAPTTLFPASYVSIPTDGAAGTPTMRSQGTGVGQSAKGSDPFGLGLAWTIPYFSNIASPGWSTVTANTVCYCTRFIGGSPATKIRLFFNNTTSGGNMRVLVASSKNAGPAATPDQVKLDTGVIACPAPGAGIPADLSFTAGGNVVSGDWLLVAADNGTMSLWTTFLNSTVSMWAGQSGYFTITSLAAIPTTIPAINTFGFQHWALAVP